MRSARSAPRAAVLVASALVLLTGCAGGEDDAPGGGPGTSTSSAPAATTTATASPTGSPTTSPTGSPTSSGAPAPDAPSTSGSPSGAPPAAGPSTDGGPPPSTAPVVGATTLPPVAAGDAAAFGDGLVATVTDTQAVQLGASGPGEVAGPGIAVTLVLRNDTSAPVDLGGLAVTASTADGVPVDPSDSPPASPAQGVLEPGGSATGTWAFSDPATGDGPLQVQVSSTSSVSVVVVQL